MAWPIRRFWSSVRAFSRIRAEEDLRSFRLMLIAAITAQGGDSKEMEKLNGELLNNLGVVVKHRPPQSSKDDILAFINKK